MTNEEFTETLQALGAQIPEDFEPNGESDVHAHLQALLASQWSEDLHGQGSDYSDALWSVRFMNLGERDGALEIAHMDGGNYTLCVEDWGAPDPMVLRYDHEEPHERCVVGRLSAVLANLGRERWEPPPPPKPGEPPSFPPVRRARRLPTVPDDNVSRVGYLHGDASTAFEKLAISADGDWIAALQSAGNYTGQWTSFGGEYTPQVQGKRSVVVWRTSRLGAPAHVWRKCNPPYLFWNGNLVGAFRDELLFGDLKTGERRGVGIGYGMRCVGLAGDSFVLADSREWARVDPSGATLISGEVSDLKKVMFSALSSDGRLLAVTNLNEEKVVVINVESGETHGVVSLPSNAGQVRFAPDGGSLLVSGYGQVFVVDTSEMSSRGLLVRPEAPGLARWVDSSRVLVAHNRRSSESVLRLHDLNGAVLREWHWRGGPIDDVAWRGGLLVTVDQATMPGAECAPDHRILLRQLK